MDNLRIVLIVVASLVIIALLVHGFWINKKERSSLFKSKNAKSKAMSSASASSYRQSEPDDKFDDVGDIRVITPEYNEETELVVDSHEPSVVEEAPVVAKKATYSGNISAESIGSKTLPPDFLMDKTYQPAVSVKASSEPTNGAPAQPVQRDLFAEEDTNQGKRSGISAAHSSANPKMVNEGARSVKSSPVIRTTADKIETTQGAAQNQTTGSHQSAEHATPTDVLVFHVGGLNGELINGNTLLNSILQSGFQYGEMKIFHRHVDPAGNGPVLFSLANMMKPGYLEPESMPDSKMSGVSLFMMLPSPGNNQQNFKLLLQTAQRIADDVDGVVLDEEHHMLTPQKIESYKNRVKQLNHKES